MNQQKKTHNTVDRVTFFMGLAVLAAIICYLIYLITQNKEEPPELVITSTYLPAMAHYAFEVKVKNQGEETVENANIKLSLYQNGKSVENGTINNAFVPVGSEETAWIVFYTKR